MCHTEIITCEVLMLAVFWIVISLTYTFTAIYCVVCCICGCKIKNTFLWEFNDGRKNTYDREAGRGW